MKNKPKKLPKVPYKTKKTLPKNAKSSILIHSVLLLKNNGVPFSDDPAKVFPCPVEHSIILNDIIVSRIIQRYNTGLFGASLSEVVERLLCKAVANQEDNDEEW